MCMWSAIGMHFEPMFLLYSKDHIGLGTGECRGRGHTPTQPGRSRSPWSRKPDQSLSVRKVYPSKVAVLVFECSSPLEGARGAWWSLVNLDGPCSTAGRR